ncbi:MAG TPA: DUF1841 family protein [Methylophaga sp.]|nr:DUF1841 family protein [Methylophaga sp.]HEC58123.1 DUF1841 family protein [Methylophaga sp.]
MFGQNRQQLRQFYHDVWQKQADKQSLSALEIIVAQVINEHPEYQSIFNSDASLEQEYFVEQGQTNPFLHMGLHISLHEQISTDRPNGIRAIYQQLKSRYGDVHTTEHHMMECLTESLWLAQRNNQPPSESDYLLALQQHVSDKNNGQ